VKTHHGSLEELADVAQDSFQAIPEECFQWSGMNEYFVDICEVSEVGVNLQDPVRLSQDNGTNVDQ
jgi:hypothetical protein